MRKIIGLTYDSKETWPVEPGQNPDANAEFDSAATIQEITGALESAGHQVKKIGGIREILRQIPHLGVDVVLNITEGFFGRNRESQVPVLLELFGIPYLGSDALTLGITLDKSVAKKVFLADGVSTPRFFVATPKDDLSQMNKIGFPLFVKPCFEGTSKGINESSKVENDEQLRAQITMIFKRYQQPALVEEFIRGREFTVVVFGNENPEAMPVIQYEINNNLSPDDFYTFRHVVEESVRYICPAPIDKSLTETLQTLAIKAYQSVGCRDFGRVDFRVNEQGMPFVLEINPLPCLAKKDTFGHTARALGKSYEDLILRIVDEGFARLNMDRQEVGLQQ